jgi:hypothetical protein
MCAENQDLNKEAKLEKAKALIKELKELELTEDELKLVNAGQSETVNPQITD